MEETPRQVMIVFLIVLRVWVSSEHQPCYSRVANSGCLQLTTPCPFERVLSFVHVIC
jgi:hypothetical protein